ncbi:MAG: FAD-binding protein [Bacillota bacterium]
MYDIAIVGAGPSGATLARLIGKNYKVLLLDKRCLDVDPREDYRIKCCGGLLAPDAQKVLAELGQGVPQSVLEGPQLFVVRTIDLDKNIERYYQRFYINIDREKFDRWLVSLIRGNVDFRFESLYKSHQEIEGGFLIKFVHKGKEYSVRTKILVGADGAFSKVRRQAFSEYPFPRKYVSIQEWYDVGEALPYFSAIFDRSVTDFYSWTIPKGNNLIIGSALYPDNNPWQKFSILKSKLSDYGFRFDKLVKKEGAFILRPLSKNNICVGEGNTALLGEAAGFISPSSAEGFSYALKSALLLAKSLEEGSKGFLERYEGYTHKIKTNIQLKNLKTPFMYNPFIRSIVMKSGIQSVEVQNKGFR